MRPEFSYLWIGFFSGTIFSIAVSQLVKKWKKNKVIKEINQLFLELSTNISQGKSKFKTRIKDTVFIESKLLDWGKVSVVYTIDKKEIAIFKEEKCISTTKELVKQEVLDVLINNINLQHQSKINDVIDLMGLTISREDFEKTISEKMKEIKIDFSNLNLKDESFVDKIINKNSQKFDMDEILDKINKYGVKSLTKEELEYLKKFK